MNATPTTRRRFLKASGLTLALPALESFGAPADAESAKAKNIVCIGTNLGFHPPAFFPKQTGRDFELPTLLKPIADHRDSFTVFSGLDHRTVGSGHGAWSTFLCGVNPVGYSLDQIVADQLGQDSRFPSIQLTAGQAVANMSHTRQGVPLPMVQRPSVLFSRLFASPKDRARNEYLLQSGHSTLDAVLEDAKRLQRSVSTADRQKLDEYFYSLRDVEKQLTRQIATLDDPVPETDYALPATDPISPALIFEAQELMYDLMALALHTDQTNVMTLFISGMSQVFTIDGETLKSGYHGLSHHGNDPDSIADLVKIEVEHMKRFNRFLNQLKTKKDVNGQPLLDNTIVLLGTGLGDSARHDSRNLPTLVAGGGFKHGQHLAFDHTADDSPLLGDLYITLMQQLGLENESFSNAKRNLNQWFS